MNANDDLAAALAGDEPDYDEAPYAPLDLEQASDWLTQIQQVRAKRQEYLDAHTAIVARLTKRLNDVLEPMARNEAWYVEALEIFHRTALTLDPKATKIQTPAGDLTSNAGQKKWVYEDEAALLEWAMANVTDAINLLPAPDPSLKKVELKKALNEHATFSDGVVVWEDGTLVPGVKVLPAERSFDVKPAE